jgi:hypothetical protein
VLSRPSRLRIYCRATNAFRPNSDDELANRINRPHIEETWKGKPHAQPKNSTVYGVMHLDGA